MKKFLMVLALVGLTSVANAQQCDEFATPSTAKYSVATNSFWSNWYIQFGIDGSVMGAKGIKVSESWHGLRNYGLNLAVGKWFTPGFGGRLKLNWNGFSIARTEGHNYFGNDGKNNYGMLAYDNLFNLSNLFCGYNESRVWNVSVFPRMGLGRNFSDNAWTPILGVGLQSSWKVSKLIGIYLEGAMNFTTNRFAMPLLTNQKSFGRTGFVTLDLGVTFNLGKSNWSKAVSLEDYEKLSNDACAKLTALRAQLKNAQDENTNLRAELAKKPKEVKAEVEKITLSSATSVFFNINSAKINSKKDIINLEAVATAAKNSGAKVVVTGNADSKTGSAAYNQKLSEARANAVADELVNLGVSRDKIEAKGVGGVADVTPYKFNRRVIVELK